MGGHRAELGQVIRQIRNRWRLKLALRGVVVLRAGEGSWRLGFWAADWTPWRAILASH